MEWFGGINDPTFLAFMAENARDLPPVVELLMDRHGDVWAYESRRDCWATADGMWIPAERRWVLEVLYGPTIEVAL